MSATTCTVVTGADGTRCGGEATVVRDTFVGEVAECGKHAAPVAALHTPVANIGRKVSVRHCGVDKVGFFVGETPTYFEVRVPVKPHGRPAGTRTIRVPRGEVRFV